MKLIERITVAAAASLGAIALTYQISQRSKTKKEKSPREQVVNKLLEQTDANLSREDVVFKDGSVQVTKEAQKRAVLGEIDDGDAEGLLGKLLGWLRGDDNA